MADPRLVAEASREVIDQVKARAKEHGFTAYGNFVVEISLHGLLLPPQLRAAIGRLAKSDGQTDRDEVCQLLLEAVRARRGG